MSDANRIPDAELAAPLAHGVSMRHSRVHFTFDFTVPDETQAAHRLVVRRVHLDATAVEEFVNLLNLHLNEWQMQQGD